MRKAILVAALVLLPALASAQPIKGSSLLIDTPRGFLRFGEEVGGSNNELEIGSKVNDPPKVRLLSKFGALGAVSWSWWRPDGAQEEVAMIQGKLSEDDPGSLGGQMEFWIRRKNKGGDSAMVLMGVITVAYSESGEPEVRWHQRTFLNLGKFSWTPQQQRDVFAPIRIVGR